MNRSNAARAGLILLGVVVTLVVLTFVFSLSYDNPDSPLSALDYPAVLADILRPEPVSFEDLSPRAFLPYVASGGEPQIKNASFEGGRQRDARWWIWPFTSLPLTGEWSEVEPGENWTAWWMEKRPCPSVPDEWFSGRPEVKLIDLDEGFPDPLRIADGRKAIQHFTFYRCGYGGVYQVAEFPAGTWKVGAFMHSWFTGCSREVHPDEPKDADCNALPDEHFWLRVGIDPTGGEDAFSSDIVWGEREEHYGRYGDERVWSSSFVLSGDGPHSVTIWIAGESSLPLKHCDMYIDGVIAAKGGQQP